MGRYLPCLPYRLSCEKSFIQPKSCDAHSYKLQGSYATSWFGVHLATNSYYIHFLVLYLHHLCYCASTSSLLLYLIHLRYCIKFIFAIVHLLYLVHLFFCVLFSLGFLCRGRCNLTKKITKCKVVLYLCYCPTILLSTLATLPYSPAKDCFHNIPAPNHHYYRLYRSFVVLLSSLLPLLLSI